MPHLEVADIFRAHGPAWREAERGHFGLGQLKVMSAIEQCRSAALGGHSLSTTRDMRSLWSDSRFTSHWRMYGPSGVVTSGSLTSPETTTYIRCSASLPQNYPLRLGALSYEPPDNRLDRSRRPAGEIRV